jgi:hypothetical protein
MTCVPPSSATRRTSQHASLKYIETKRTCSKDVVVPSEPFGVPRAQIPLGEPRGHKVRSHKRIYPYTKATHVVSSIRHELIGYYGKERIIDSRDDWDVRVIGAKFWIKPMDEPEGNGDK